MILTIDLYQACLGLFLVLVLILIVMFYRCLKNARKMTKEQLVARLYLDLNKQQQTRFLSFLKLLNTDKKG